MKGKKKKTLEVASKHGCPACYFFVKTEPPPYFYSTASARMSNQNFSMDGPLKNSQTTVATSEINACNIKKTCIDIRFKDGKFTPQH